MGTKEKSAELFREYEHVIHCSICLQAKGGDE